MQGPAADLEVVASLLSWAGGDSPRRGQIPYLDGDVAGYAALALRQLGDAHAGFSFDALLARIPAVSGPEAMPVVGEALRRAFPAGRIPAGTAFEDLDEQQRRLLRALAASPSTWEWREFTQFGNFIWLVGSYGLPDKVEALRSYVGAI